MLTVTRMDLDGAGSPMALVTKILKAEPDLPIPVPVEDLAQQLDITEIRVLAADGFEGGLITDAGRSEGFILVNGAAGRERRRVLGASISVQMGRGDLVSLSRRAQPLWRPVGEHACVMVLLRGVGGAANACEGDGYGLS